jgi:hypothetical protein
MGWVHKLARSLAERLDIGRDAQRLTVGELGELVMLAPGEESDDLCRVGHARVPVADGGGEELQEATRGVLARVGDDRRPNDGRCDRGREPRRLDDRDNGQREAMIRFDFGHGFSVT